MDREGPEVKRPGSRENVPDGASAPVGGGSWSMPEVSVGGRRFYYEDPGTRGSRWSS